MATFPERSDAVAAELGALRRQVAGLSAELAALRNELRGLIVLLQPAVQPHVPPSLAAPADALPARRRAERLAAAVQQRLSGGADPSDDTELDLLIDRLHDLVDAADLAP